MRKLGIVAKIGLCGLFGLMVAGCSDVGCNSGNQRSAKVGDVGIFPNQTDFELTLKGQKVIKRSGYDNADATRVTNYWCAEGKELLPASITGGEDKIIEHKFDARGNLIETPVDPAV